MKFLQIIVLLTFVLPTYGQVELPFVAGTYVDNWEKTQRNDLAGYLLITGSDTTKIEAIAKRNETYKEQTFKINDIYFEFLGNGIGASICYERQLTSKPGPGLRAGVGYFSGDEKFRLSIPVGVNYLFMLTKNKSF